MLRSPQMEIKATAHPLQVLGAHVDLKSLEVFEHRTLGCIPSSPTDVRLAEQVASFIGPWARGVVCFEDHSRSRSKLGVWSV